MKPTEANHDDSTKCNIHSNEDCHKGKEPNTTQKATHSPSYRVYQNKVGNKKQEVENENEPPSRATFSNSTSRPSALDVPPPSPASTVGKPNMDPAREEKKKRREAKVVATSASIGILVALESHAQQEELSLSLSLISSEVKVGS
ncbi:uncharacterized protein G2W53_018557 [Senna tora]|uniref:Uncharacterized protein n=1 Tax=Senna tora TaxID=362788 RepID=A0A834TS75_9FABA|nr:uncharacterized protein G2W53_018557 [Senna tora]